MEDFRIRTLKDNLSRSRAKRGIDLKKYYLPHGYEIQKRKYPLGAYPGQMQQQKPNFLEEVFNFFKGLFSDHRIAITDQVWQVIIPFSGRNYDEVKQRARPSIRYVVDLVKYFPHYAADAINWRGREIGYDAAINEFKQERINSGKPYIITPIGFNPSWNDTHFDQAKNSTERNIQQNWTTYFYGAPSEANFPPNGGGGSGSVETGGGGGGPQSAGFGGMDLSTLLLIGAGVYFIADSKPKKSTTRRKK